MLLDAGTGGSMGLVLNKEMNFDLSHTLTKYGLSHVPVYCGGPVDEERMFYLHDIPDVQGAIEISDGLYVGGSLREIAECLKAPSRNYRVKFFMGYSGWTGGQMEEELESEAWVVVDRNVDVLGEVDGMWQESLQRLNDVYYKMWLNYPIDPQFN